MLHLLFIIMSYGSLLALLMQGRGGADLICTVVIFAIGTGLIVYKKVYKIAFWKSKQYFLIIASTLFAISRVRVFYDRWIISSKVKAISTMLHIPVETMILILSILLSLLSIYFCYAGLQIIVKIFSDSNRKNNFVISLYSCVIASVVMEILAQYMIETPALSMGFLNFAWGVLIVSVLILVLYCVIGRITPAISVGVGIFMVVSTINVYVYRFRSRLFEPVDIFSAGVAMNVADNYSLLPIPVNVLVGWALFVIMLMLVYRVHHRAESGLTTKRKFVLLAVCAVSSVAIFCYSSNLKTHHWHTGGAYYNGYILDFVSKFKEISVPKPDKYSTELIDKLANEYAVDDEVGDIPSESPHIIVIMDEAFSDLSIIGEFSTNKEIVPFISSLKENTISGYALASVYGGNTANSEYEFLTGNSLAWLSPNAVPYQQYIHSSTYSMVSYLKSAYNYKCLAMHPFDAGGWNRPAAYKYLGFDECYFVEDFPQLNYVREFISDQEMFEFLIDTYEAQKENPLFIFGVTVQNHGGYTYTGDNYNQHISLNDYDGEFADVEQYLSVIHETDKAVEQLVKYFQTVNEDVVIVFFGDHQPKMEESFYQAIDRTTEDALDEQQNFYKVPFFIWANYDIEEEYIDCTSLNYLSSYVYDTAEVVLPPYNHFLQEMEDNIPAINANGFYSLAAGRYLPFDEANEEELRWLDLYEVLQYNNIFDQTHLNEKLFPILE